MKYQPKIPANLHMVADATVGPVYQHDCSCCIFLGRQSTPHGEVDLYVHPDIGFSRSVIARYSSDGPEYSSGLVFSYGRIPPLTEARRRAQALGLLDYDVYEALHYAVPETPEFDEMKRALPFTIEYQMMLAYERGDIERSSGLATNLVDSGLDSMRKYKPERQRADALDEVQERVIKVLRTFRGYSWSQAFLHVTEVLAHETSKAEAELAAMPETEPFLG